MKDNSVKILMIYVASFCIILRWVGIAKVRKRHQATIVTDAFGVPRTVMYQKVGTHTG